MNQAMGEKKNALDFLYTKKEKAWKPMCSCCCYLGHIRRTYLNHYRCGIFLPTPMSAGANELAYFLCVFLSCTVIGLSWTVVLGNTLETESLTI